MSIIFQRNIYANETRLLVAAFIVFFLLYYMYSICKKYMIWETTMEQLMQEQKDNENKLHKFDIIEKFQEVEIEKKQRKDN